jgi:hypothetical protein
MIRRILEGYALLWFLYIILAWLSSVIGIFKWQIFSIFNILVLIGGIYYALKNKNILQKNVVSIIKKNLHFDKRNYLNWLLIFSILLWLIFATYSFSKLLLLPSTNWDSMTYHLPKIAHGDEVGSLWYDGELNASRAYFSPSNAEILNIAAFAIAGNDVLIELPQLICSLLIPLVLYQFAKDVFRINYKFSFISTLSLLSIPLYWLQATTTQNDLIFTFIFLFSLLQINYLYKSFNTKNFIFATISIAILIGTKYHGLVIGGAIGLILLFVLYQNIKNLKRLNLKLVILVLAGCALVALPNYLIAQIYYDSFLHQPAGTSAHAKPGINTLIANIKHFGKWFYSWDTSNLEFYSHDYGHMGLAFMSAPFIAFFLFIQNIRNLLLNIKSYFIFLFPITFFTAVFIFVHYPDDWDLRLFIPIPLITFSLVILFFLHNFRKRMYIVMLTTILLGTISLFQFYILATQVDNKRNIKDALNRVLAQEEMLQIADVTKSYRPSLKVLAEDIESKDELVITYLGHEDTWSYPFYGSNWRNKVIYVRDTSDLLEETEVFNADYAVVAYYKKGDIDFSFVPHQWQEIASDDYFTIYQVISE